MHGGARWGAAALVVVLGCHADGELPRGAEAEPSAQAAPAGLGLPPLSRAQLLDPKTCAGCHPVHYREWEMSMHAYAANDPVFVAMNQRGQRETGGALGDFCVRCHAPMAVREGLTTDGLNLAEVPQKLKGVTCYFCHNTVRVGPQHFNNPLDLADDTTMRSGLRDAVSPGVHGVAYEALLDGRSSGSAVMCGSCHDIVNPKDAPIERTFREYKASYFNAERGTPASETCAGCHMPVARPRGPIAALPGLPDRALHDHTMPGVDVALGDWPGDAEFRRRTECELARSVYIQAVVNDQPGAFLVRVESDAGHAQPSGAAQDRRLWLELIAYDAQGRVMLKSGVVADGAREEYPEGDPRRDRFTQVLRDRMYDAEGKETHDFWEAVRTDPRMIPTAPDPALPHYVDLKFQTPTRQQPARIEMRLKMRPVGVDVLEDLVATGDLDPAVIARTPTFTLWRTNVVWTPDVGRTWLNPRVKYELDCDFSDEGPDAP